MKAHVPEQIMKVINAALIQKIKVFLHHWRSFQKPFQRRKCVLELQFLLCSQGFRENKVVCYATVSWKGALRDDTTNGCEAEDLGLWGLNDITSNCLSFILLHLYSLLRTAHLSYRVRSIRERHRGYKFTINYRLEHGQCETLAVYSLLERLLAPLLLIF